MKIPRRERRPLRLHGNGSESSLPYCSGHLLYEITAGERTVISGPVFKVHGGRREREREIAETNMESERSQLARSSPSGLGGARGRLPHNSLCNADSLLLIYVFFLLHHLLPSLLPSRVLTKQRVLLRLQRQRVCAGGTLREIWCEPSPSGGKRSSFCGCQQ